MCIIATSVHLPCTRMSRSTAKTFYAAGLFLEVLRQFGDLQPEVRLPTAPEV